MANKEQLEKLREGRDVWNDWRAAHPEVRPDLHDADLRETNLRGYNLHDADLRGADLGGADLDAETRLDGARLWGANFHHADVEGVDLTRARYISDLGNFGRHWLLLLLFFLAAYMFYGLGERYGLPNLFRDDPDLYGDHGWTAIRNSPVFLSLTALILLAASIWTIFYFLGREHYGLRSKITLVEYGRYLSVRLAYSLAFVLAVYVLSSVVGGRSVDLGRFLASLALSLFVTLLILCVLISIMHVILKRGFPGLGKITRRFISFLVLPITSALAILLIVTSIEFPGVWFFVLILSAALWVTTRRHPSINIEFLSAFLASLTILLLLALLYHKLIPAVSIFLLLAILVVLYAVFQFAPERFRLVLGAVLVAWIVSANGCAKYKYTFPGIQRTDDPDSSYYEHPLNLRDPETLRKEARAPLLDPKETLIAWRKQTPFDRPLLVILTTSGGAYRASYWTAVVLDTLLALEPDSLPGFRQSVHLITGASGGMVAGAYFAAGTDAAPTRDDALRIQEWETFCEDRGNGAAHPGCCNADDATLVGRIDQDVCISSVAGVDGKYGSVLPLRRNSLDLVAQQLVQQDLPNIFWPGQLNTDRGKILEQQWIRLNRSFASLRDAEAAGRRPSLILSPMLVETGQPLLISNLDLDTLPVNAADPSGHPAAGQAVEFFKLFPGAYDHFRLQTAVRMNASFPYVSPAVSLPTRPLSRVVDAGYYDNYGVNLATAYLAVPRIRNELIAHASGVVIVQVRAFPEENPRTRKDDSPLARAFHWLTSPISGAGSARSSSMVFRNKQELRQLIDLYELTIKVAPDAPRQSPFIRTVVFENSSKASMSWYLPDNELKALRASLVTDANKAALETLICLWDALDQ